MSELKTTSGKWEYYEEHLGDEKINFMFHSVKDQNGINIGRFHDKEIAELIAKAPEMLELLKELQYCNYVEAEDSHCPKCGQHYSHAPNCKLGKLLKEFKQ